MTAAASFTGSGALFVISGEIPVNATWTEDIYFSEAGTGMDISDLDWKLVIREDEDDSTGIRTLSIDGGELTIEEDENDVPSILRIFLADQTLNQYEGDFLAQLASEDASGVVTLWASGTISLRPNPVVF